MSQIRFSASAARVTGAGAALFGLGLVLPYLQAKVSSRGTRRLPSPLAEKASIAVVVPAYLEASVIGVSVDRLRRQLRGWAGPSEIVVVASDDETAQAAGAADLVVRTGRGGKAAAMNAGVAATSSDVVLLTDANCEIHPDDWPTILHSELGRAHLVSAAKQETSGHDRLFWKYERRVRRNRGFAPSLSVVGEFLAFRRSDYRPVPDRVLSDDIWVAIDFDQRGLTVSVSPQVEAREPAAQPEEQWERRIRIAAGQIGEALPRWRGLLRTEGGRSYLAHKGYRLSVGPVGFWMAMLGFLAVLPPVSTVVGPASVVWAVLRYRGRIQVGSGAAAALIALQAMPVLGFLRVLRRRRDPVAVGWVKVHR